MFAQPRYSLQTVFVVLACSALAACSSFSGISTTNLNPVQWLTPYKADIIQGNFVSKEQVAELRPGLPREQVKALMGTPLLASVFHADRWDYVFTLKRQGVPDQSYKYTMFFKGDVLERFGGDELPSESEFINLIDSKRELGKVPVLEATEEQMLKAASKSKPAEAEAAPDRATAVPAPAPVNRAYPPLEGPAR